VGVNKITITLSFFKNISPKNMIKTDMVMINDREEKKTKKNDFILKGF